MHAPLEPRVYREPGNEPFLGQVGQGLNCCDRLTSELDQKQWAHKQASQEAFLHTGQDVRLSRALLKVSWLRVCVVSARAVLVQAQHYKKSFEGAEEKLKEQRR
eukprot:3702528-Amphidinium_carterae.1